MLNIDSFCLYTKSSLFTQEKIMFVLGVILFVLSVAGLGSYIAGQVMAISSSSVTVAMILLYSGIAAFLLFGFLSNLVFRNLKYKHGKKGAVNVFYGLTIVQYFLLNYTVVAIAEIFGFIIGFIIGLFINDFGGKGGGHTKVSGSQIKSEVTSYINNHVPNVTPSSPERYEFELKEAYSHFCQSNNFNPNNRKLCQEFEKQYYKKVYG